MNVGARSTPSHSTNTHSFTASGQTFILDSKYQMIKPVGTGAYGVVIAAKNEETGKNWTQGKKGSD